MRVVVCGDPELRDPLDSAPLKNVAFCNLFQRLRGCCRVIRRATRQYLDLIDHMEPIRKGAQSRGSMCRSSVTGSTCLLVPHTTVPSLRLRNSGIAEFHNCGDQEFEPKWFQNNESSGWDGFCGIVFISTLALHILRSFSLGRRQTPIQADCSLNVEP